MTFQYGIIIIVITMIPLYYIFKHTLFYRYWYILQSIQPENRVVIFIY